MTGISHRESRARIASKQTSLIFPQEDSVFLPSRKGTRRSETVRNTGLGAHWEGKFYSTLAVAGRQEGPQLLTQQFAAAR
jgi:hypothetical protein